MSKKLIMLLLLAPTFMLCKEIVAQNETPSGNLAVVIAPSEFEFNTAEDSIFEDEVGDLIGQKYIVLSRVQAINPGLNPPPFLLEHIKSVNGTYPAGILLHTSHGAANPSIQMESFVDTVFTNDAMQASLDRLDAYMNAGWVVLPINQREINIKEMSTGHFSIFMYPKAITNRAHGLDTFKPLVYIATCYGSLMLPAYVGKGARVAVGDVDTVKNLACAQKVKQFFRRLNGREGQIKRVVANAWADFSDFGAVGLENTTLAPSVLSLSAPCPIKAGDIVIITLDTKCDIDSIPDIIGINCTIEGEAWLNPTTLQGTCVAPPPPGAHNFDIILDWVNTKSANNAARLDGNTIPFSNAHGPAHDDYVESFSCPQPTQTIDLSTGVNRVDNTFYPLGTTCPYWLVFEEFNNVVTPRPVNVIDTSNFWGNPPPGSQWAGYSSTCLTNTQHGIIKYKTEFVLNAVDTNLRLDIGYTVDDRGPVLLNGNVILTTPQQGNHTTPIVASITNPNLFVVGTNVIEVHAENDYAPHGFAMSLLLTATAGTLVSSEESQLLDALFSQTTIYPNPTVDRLQISGLSPKIKFSYRVLDIWGKELVESESPDINVEKLSSGIYILELKSSKGSKFVRFLKL